MHMADLENLKTIRERLLKDRRKHAADAASDKATPAKRKKAINDLQEVQGKIDAVDRAIADEQGQAPKPAMNFAQPIVSGQRRERPPGSAS